LQANLGESELLLEAQEWRRQADLLLSRSRLVDLLAKHGRVIPTGAYRLNLMLSGDIDIKLVNPRTTKNSAKTILNNLICQNFFNGYTFYDCTSRNRPEGFPRGFFIGLKRNYTLFNRRKWTVDIWIVRKEYEREVRLMHSVESRLDHKSRSTMLKFKNLRRAMRIEVPSATIYRAVMEEGISSRKKFLEYAKTRR